MGGWVLCQRLSQGRAAPQAAGHRRSARLGIEPEPQTSINPSAQLGLGWRSLNRAPASSRAERPELRGERRGGEIERWCRGRAAGMLLSRATDRAPCWIERQQRAASASASRDAGRQPRCLRSRQLARSRLRCGFCCRALVKLAASSSAGAQRASRLLKRWCGLRGRGAVRAEKPCQSPAPVAVRVAVR